MNVDAFIERHRLPPAFRETATGFYVPLAEGLERRLAGNGGTLVLGINGAQGSGKSTLSAFVSEYLRARHARCVAELSIDDLYLTRAERRRLAADVHPLLATRGVPGTHDVGLGIETLDALRNARKGDSVELPRFDKAEDERLPVSDWPRVEGSVDLAILEGWCVASSPEPGEALDEPLNALERTEDRDGRWRRFVNSKLAGEYHELFRRLDALVFLEVPGFDAVLRWRLEQEHKLRDARGSASGVMSDEEVRRFVSFFERITRANLADLPARADVVLRLDSSHRVREMTGAIG